jgi:hypothetical protein
VGIWRKFLLGGNVDVFVFLFDWDPQAMGGLGSPMAVGNFSSGGDRSEQKVASSCTIAPAIPPPMHLTAAAWARSAWRDVRAHAVGVAR